MSFSDGMKRLSVLLGNLLRIPATSSLRVAEKKTMKRENIDDHLPNDFRCLNVRLSTFDAGGMMICTFVVEIKILKNKKKTS